MNKMRYSKLVYVCFQDKGTDYQCQCPPGYNGRHCESNAVSCATSPCKNGATCLDGAQSYMCICQAGFSGINCEVETNECASSPCLNGKLHHTHLLSEGIKRTWHGENTTNKAPLKAL